MTEKRYQKILVAQYSPENGCPAEHGAVLYFMPRCNQVKEHAKPAGFLSASDHRTRSKFGWAALYRRCKNAASGNNSPTSAFTSGSSRRSISEWPLGPSLMALKRWYTFRENRRPSIIRPSNSGSTTRLDILVKIPYHESTLLLQVATRRYSIPHCIGLFVISSNTCLRRSMWECGNRPVFFQAAVRKRSRMGKPIVQGSSSFSTDRAISTKEVLSRHSHSGPSVVASRAIVGKIECL